MRRNLFTDQSDLIELFEYKVISLHKCFEVTKCDRKQEILNLFGILTSDLSLKRTYLLDFIGIFRNNGGQLIWIEEIYKYLKTKIISLVLTMKMSQSTPYPSLSSPTSSNSNQSHLKEALIKTFHTRASLKIQTFQLTLIIENKTLFNF